MQNNPNQWLTTNYGKNKGTSWPITFGTFYKAVSTCYLCDTNYYSDATMTVLKSTNNTTVWAQYRRTTDTDNYWYSTDEWVIGIGV